MKSLDAMVAMFLANAQLASETIAIAYNILSHPRIIESHCWHGDSPSSEQTAIHGPQSDASCQRALVILSALSLAVSLVEDCPRGISYWVQRVAEDAFSAAQLSASNRLVLAKLEWSLNPLATPLAIAAALETLSAHARQEERQPAVKLCIDMCDDFEGEGAAWTTRFAYGLPTPDASPDGKQQHQLLLY
jgi:hypothetical protein